MSEINSNTNHENNNNGINKHPVYDLLTHDVRNLLREILSNDAEKSITYIYGVFSNGKKTLIELLKRIFRVVEITDELSISHYYQGYMDGKLEVLKDQFDFEPDLFVNMEADYNYLRYYASYTFQNWLKNHEVPVIIITNFIPPLINFPQYNTENIKVIKMQHTFRSTDDSDFPEWTSYVTEEMRVKIKPALPKCEVINDDAIKILIRVANGLE
jgi:hypothetical protein